MQGAHGLRLPRLRDAFQCQDMAPSREYSETHCLPRGGQAGTTSGDSHGDDSCTACWREEQMALQEQQYRDIIGRKKQYWEYAPKLQRHGGAELAANSSDKLNTLTTQRVVSAHLDTRGIRAGVEVVGNNCVCEVSLDGHVTGKVRDELDWSKEQPGSGGGMMTAHNSPAGIPRREETTDCKSQSMTIRAPFIARRWQLQICPKIIWLWWFFGMTEVAKLVCQDGYGVTNATNNV